MALIAGIDIGGTKISAILVDDDGAITARGVVAAPASHGGPAMADAAAGLVRALVADVGGDLVAAGVGAAGVIDSDRGVIRAASALFADWAGFPLADELAVRLGVPVRIENDVNAFLQGEVAWGGGARDVLGVMLGTGVGGALLLDGQLRGGPHGAAGEIGHTPGYSTLECTCGQVGHLETVASGRSIGLRYGERTGRQGLGAEAVADLARQGDPTATAVFVEAGRAVALAGATAAGLLDLTTVIVGGGVSEAWDLLWPGIAATLEADSPVSGVPLSVERAQLGADAVALGAIAAAREHVLTLPARSGS
jgi:glucokinase